MKSRRGITLILILAVILVVVWLANIALVLISSQSRFTHHQVSRIQAFYAAQAGINYALERLRQRDDLTWIPGSGETITKDLCNQSSCDVEDSEIPFYVEISIGPPGSGPGNTTPVRATATYTYSP
jgi:Tfp pilus assembly protein PilX